MAVTCESSEDVRMCLEEELEFVLSPKMRLVCLDARTPRRDSRECVDQCLRALHSNYSLTTLLLG